MTKYLEVAQWLRDQIEAGRFKAGERLMGEVGLCEKFGVSRQTARSAIALLEKDGLVVRKQGSGTYVNNFLSGYGRKKIGLLLTYADDYIFPSIISGIEGALSEHGHRISLYLTRNRVDTERSQLLSLLSDNIDGLLVEAVKSALPNPNLDLYKELAAQGVPVLFMNVYHSGLDCNYIINDDVKGGRLAARHLIESGHTKIGGIFKHDDVQGSFRYKGFIEELYARGLHLNENSVIWYSTETLSELFSPARISLLIERLKGVSAVICYNDQVAVKLVQSCAGAGIRVPQDLSVVSFDNSNLSSVSSVPLTTVTHPGAQMGRFAAQSILKAICSPKFSLQHVYSPDLVIRDSVHMLMKG
ncbi:MAG: GntR family transcriptional regulator [Oscillospiraceae bacterium]|nr:GntR family transcriptional regulator [Oscillospiraceae bacterium]